MFEHDDWTLVRKRTKAYRINGEFDIMLSESDACNDETEWNNDMIEGLAGVNTFALEALKIPTEPILEFLAKHQGEWSTHGKGYSMPTVQDAMPPETSYEVQLAKMRQLYHYGYVGGCDCFFKYCR